MVIMGCGGGSSSNEKALEWERTQGRENRDRMEK